MTNPFRRAAFAQVPGKQPGEEHAEQPIIKDAAGEYLREHLSMILIQP